MFGSIEPKVGNVDVTETSPDSVSIKAIANVTNPTPYTAHVPFISIHVFSNGSLVGEARAQNLDIKKGENTDITVSATWNPSLGGEEGRFQGRNLLSQYLSGYNTTITVKTHRGSIP